VSSDRFILRIFELSKVIILNDKIMFTGIIESMGVVKELVPEQENLHITIECDFTDELKVDQSVAHDGVCLTTVAISGNTYTVTAIKETIDKSNFGSLKVGDLINLERAMVLGARLDGHIVQGHVDQTAVCTGIHEEEGSWIYDFEYEPGKENITIEKGSITVNGTSLTVINSKANTFSVAIIPYTYEHTNFHTFQIGTRVNLEFDVIGKYVARLLGK
jgi:riboflavin synthase